jgi:hypothetical protein
MLKNSRLRERRKRGPTQRDEAGVQMERPDALRETGNSAAFTGENRIERRERHDDEQQVQWAGDQKAAFMSGPVAPRPSLEIGWLTGE